MKYYENTYWADWSFQSSKDLQSFSHIQQSQILIDGVISFVWILKLTWRAVTGCILTGMTI